MSDRGGGPGNPERGAALLLTFILMLVFAGLALGVATYSHNSQIVGAGYLQDKQAFYIAEAGLQRARQALEADEWQAAVGAGNAYDEDFGAGRYLVTIVDNDDGTYTITSEGYVPNESNPLAQRQVMETNLDVSVSSTNLALSATASALSENPGQPASHANDGSTTTFWGALIPGNGQWLRLDFGSATTLDKMVIREKQNITGISLWYSSDGLTWTSVPGVSGDGDDTDTTWTFTFTATSARYFRGEFTASSIVKKVGVEEFEAYDTSGQTVSITDGGVFTTTW